MPDYYGAGLGIAYDLSPRIVYSRYSEATYVTTRDLRKIPVVRYVRPIRRDYRVVRFARHFRPSRSYRSVHHYRPRGYIRTHRPNYRSRLGTDLRFGRHARPRHHGGFSIRFDR